MTKPTYVLGTGLSHNGSACLLKDGEIVVAIEKERITRYKNDGFNDKEAIQYCLDAEGIGWDDITIVVQNCLYGDLENSNGWYFGTRNIPDTVKCVTISHHIAHAYCAAFASPFDSSGVLVIDGCGSGYSKCTDALDNHIVEWGEAYHEVISYYSFEENIISPIHKQYSFVNNYPNSDKPAQGFLKDSIGGFYAGINQYVFGDTVDVGQLMGLSSYGMYPEEYGQPYTFDGLNIKWSQEWTKKLKPRNESPDRFKGNFNYFADLAKFSQVNIDQAVVGLLNKIHKLHPNTNLCFAGGVAFNILTNSKIVQETPFKNLYVPPPANDAGIAIGCAYYGWHTVLGKDRVKHRTSVYLGSPYDTAYEEVASLVEQMAPHIKVTKPKNLNVLTAKAIATGKVVGWYKGGAEIGPRALGHRSILGNPCDPGMKDHINNTIKNRPDFRPFAPAVLAEDASIYFDIDRPSPYMLMVFDVREEWLGKIPAVTHVDGTARVQTVSETDDKDFYELLKEVKRETGIGMVLNTSFNRKHEPIVERPNEAVQMFLDTPMDALVLGPYLLTK